MYIYKIYKQGLPTIVSKTLYLYIYTSSVTKEINTICKY